MYKFAQLTQAQKNALPDTTGTPRNDASTLAYQRTLAKQEPTFDLDFDSATSEMKPAFSFALGLGDYGSGMSQWVYCDILKGRTRYGKSYQVWALYVSQVGGACYSDSDIKKAFDAYTPEQKAFILSQCAEHLDAALDYIQQS